MYEARGIQMRIAGACKKCYVNVDCEQFINTCVHIIWHLEVFTNAVKWLVTCAILEWECCFPVWMMNGCIHERACFWSLVYAIFCSMINFLPSAFFRNLASTSFHHIAQNFFCSGIGNTWIQCPYTWLTMWVALTPSVQVAYPCLWKIFLTLCASSKSWSLSSMWNGVVYYDDACWASLYSKMLQEVNSQLCLHFLVCRSPKPKRRKESKEDQAPDAIDISDSDTDGANNAIEPDEVNLGAEELTEQSIESPEEQWYEWNSDLLDCLWNISICTLAEMVTLLLLVNIVFS